MLLKREFTTMLTVEWNCDCGPYLASAVHGALSILVRGRKNPVARVGIDKLREVIRERDTNRRRKGERRMAVAASWSILRFLTTIAIVPAAVITIVVVVVVVVVILHT